MTDFVESVTPDAPHFVYTFYDADGRELYIGCSGSIGRRISSHMSTQPWWPDVAYFDARRYPNQREDFLDHEPTYEESAAWFDANDPDWRDRFRPLTRRRSA